MMQYRHYQSNRSRRGAISSVAGQMGEDSVIRHYCTAGYQFLASRWRGCGGEIDLIFRLEQTVIFVEVKTSSSHAAAAERLSDRQIRRIFSAASEYIGNLPDGQSTDMRFDAALVDSIGRIDVIEAAFWMN